jgi:hypothetical protein
MDIFSRLQQMVNNNQIHKGRVYLSHGATPPKGVVTKQGRYGGRYYETRSISPAHAFAEIGAARAKENLDINLQKTEEHINQNTEESSDKIKTVRNIYADIKKYLETGDFEKTTRRDVIKKVSDIQSRYITEPYGPEYHLGNLVYDDLNHMRNVKVRLNRGHDEYYISGDPKIRARRMKGYPFIEPDENRVKHSSWYNREGEYSEIPARGETNPIRTSFKNDPDRSFHDIEKRTKVTRKKKLNPGRRKNLE